MAVSSIDTRISTRLFPVGKVWLPVAGKKAGRIVFDRDLPEDILIQASSSLVIMANSKRAGKMDADYRTFLPTDVFDRLLEEQKAKKAARAAAVAA